MSEFDKDWLAPEHPESFKGCDCYAGQESEHDNRVFQASQTRHEREWLRSSLASLLSYVEEKITCGAVNEPEYYRGWNEGLADARSIIAEIREELESV